MPKAIQIDRGREFVNEKLEQWCKEQGIELRLTALYSPPKNGVAERMNRTLTELARANLNSHEIPEYLWEYVRTRNPIANFPKSNIKYNFRVTGPCSMLRDLE